jgi:hypothetical protein
MPSRQVTIWLLVIYGTATAVAYAYFVGLHLSWRPPRVGPWDVAAIIVQWVASASAAWFAVMGVGITLIEHIRRKWLADGVLAALGFTGLMVLQFTLRLSAKSTFVDVVRAIGLGAASGLGMAVVIAIVVRFTASRRDVDLGFSFRTRQAVFLGIVGLSFVVSGVELLTPRVRNDGETVVVARFEAETSWLQIEKRRPPILGDSAGVLRVCNGGKSNAVVLMNDEWPRLVELVSSAPLSSKPEWRRVGDLNDATPGNPTTLTLSAGVGLRFELASPGDAPVVYVVQTSDVPRLQAALAEVGSSLR